ncbi:hypothetical protein [Actinacidiphila soli]|uniref:hypothetical protein n=1 Tax=Actinacidiphila soli TaxID=2487275 RepID=UPI000FCA784E|nr:hypothetical protein [Actinacidiphila soli]
MTTVPNTDAPPEVTQAEAEAREADNLLAALEERVRDGDSKVTPQQLAEQRELGRFAKLRAEAARRKAERAAADAAETERARVIAQAVTLVEQADPAKVAAAYDAARTAVAELVAAVAAHDDAMREAAALLRQVEAPAIMRHVASPTGGDWEHAPASRTAPTVEPQQGVAAVSLETGRTLAAIGTGPCWRRCSTRSPPTCRCRRGSPRSSTRRFGSTPTATASRCAGSSTAP